MEKDLRRALQDCKGRTGRRGWRCPDETRLAAFAEGGLNDAQRTRVQTHLAGCDFCLQQVAFLKEPTDLDALPEVPPALLARARALPRARPSWAFEPSWSFARSWGGGTLLAGAISVCVIVAVQQNAGRPPLVAPAPSPSPSAELPTVTPPGPPPADSVPPAPDPVFPRPDPDKRRSSREALGLPQLLFPSEDVTVEGANLQLRWKGTSQSVFYEVRVTAADGQLIWETKTDQTQVLVPAEVPLNPGQKYYVWVVEYLPEGKSLQSKAVAFHLAK